MAAKSCMFGLALAVVVAIVSAASNDTVTYSGKAGGNATALTVPVSEKGTVTPLPGNKTITTPAIAANKAVTDEVTDGKQVKKMKKVKCYDCYYFMRGTNLEGNEACEFIDPLIREQEAGTQECEGYCVKQMMSQNALVSYLYVSRHCQPECVEETTQHYGNDLFTTCCTDDYCNTATTTTATMATTLATAAAVAILSAGGWF